MSDWVETAKGIASIAQTLAIVLGGAWAYFKFVRGRTFARRAEVALEPSILSSGGARMVKVAIKVRNTGASKIALDPGLSALYLYAATARGVRPHSNIKWGKHVMVAPILTEHRWIEAHEVVNEDALMPVDAHGITDDATPVAYKMVCHVLARSRIRRNNDQRWIANAVIDAEGREFTVVPTKVTEEDREKILRDLEDQALREQEASDAQDRAAETEKEKKPEK